MSIIEDIQRAKLSNAYRKFIDYIRFPKYKNISEDAKIDFDFPLTVFVGKNGSGKSSVLKALYGCVEGKSLGDYWFSTDVDPIQEGEGNRNCVIYNYFSSEEEREYEVLIQRSLRGGNPDYWETARPVARYGMKRHPTISTYRKSKISTHLVYIDFHSVLSAFDQYRYFIKSGTISEVNRYLRKKSKSLHRCINDNEVHTWKGVPQNESPINLSQSDLDDISKILGKSYLSGKVIKHKFFRLWGNSIIFETNNLKYSEAFAGSGETAVAVLVKKLAEVQTGSLILLDEPEVCLHPGAQKRLLDYLLQKCLRKQLQIVISTHSPEFVKHLPNNAIKVFDELPDGKIQIINESNYLSAFFSIGADISTVKTIIVEDILAKTIIESVAKNMGDDILAQIKIVVHPGGEDTINKSIAIYSELNDSNKYIVFDGDQRKDLVDIHQLPGVDMTKVNLERLIKNQTGTLAVKLFPLNRNETDESLIAKYKRYLAYYRNRVSYLPLNVPEEIIWNEEVMRFFVDESAHQQEILSLTDYKERFRLTSKYHSDKDNSGSIFEIEKVFIRKWIKRSDESYNNIVSIINCIIGF